MILAVISINIILLYGIRLEHFIITTIVILSLISVNYFYKHKANKIAIGMGDIKLLLVLFISFNISVALVSLWLASILALSYYVIMKFFNKHVVRNNIIPFGLFISLGFFISFTNDNLIFKLYRYMAL